MLTTEQRRELAALEALQDNVETVEEYAARMAPKMAPFPRHQLEVLQLFELSRHEEVYAIIAEPPRHGKTTAISLGLSYRNVYDPGCLNFYATFGQSLSLATSRKIRKLTRAAGVPMSTEVANAQEWETVFGGGLKATSIGGDVTGRGCNGGVIVADDLIKGRKFAESKLVRDAAWDWLRDDLMSRLEPGASLFINATRWHEDDPIGRLLEDGLGLPWIVIEFPAVVGVDGKATDEREDRNARALWPEGGYDLARLAKIRLRGEHGWWSLYQQKPSPRGGGMFKGKWFVVVDRAPSGGRWVRRWDLAASVEQGSAFTSGPLVGLVDGKLFVSDMKRGQWSSHERDEIIVATAQQDGTEVEIWLPQDPGQAGKSQKAYFAQMLHGYRVHFERETGSKELRAEPYASQCEAGNVHVVRGPWMREFIYEHEVFPVGRYKDQVDAMSGAYAALLKKPKTNVHVDGGWVGRP